jgi:hypothetical protein
MAGLRSPRIGEEVKGACRVDNDPCGTYGLVEEGKVVEFVVRD